MVCLWLRRKEMKKSVPGLIFLVTLTVLGISLSACDLMKPGESKPAAPVSSPGTLNSQWAMTRVSIEPALPSAAPDMAVDMVLPKSPTWKITASGNQLNVTYDDKKTWFNPNGFDVTTNTPTTTVNPDFKSGAISGGGHIQGDKLPGVLGVVGMVAGISNVSIDYTNKVDITLKPSDEINATITWSAKGTYNDKDGKKNLNQQGKITYSGKRK